MKPRATGTKYSCRSSVFRPAVAYELKADRLVHRGPTAAADILFADIAAIAVFRERRVGSSRLYRACTIEAGGKKFRLTAAHRVGLLHTQDRTGFYIPFIKAFTRRALAHNPSIRFIDAEFQNTIKYKAIGILAVLALGLMRRLPRRLAASASGAVLRWTGPMSRSHRHARDQLGKAFPAMAPRETRAVLRGMWNHVGRTFGEYGHIPELRRFSTDTPAAGLVVMDDRTAELFRRIGSERHGALMFGAHLGNWEIPATAARAAGRDIALLYRPQLSSAITDQLIQMRSQFAGRLIEAGSGAPLKLFKALHDGWLVGMLVDHHDTDGIEVSFLGQTCRVSPLLAKLARSRDWPVYGARAVRLPDQRHRHELIGPLQFPRDASGAIDVQGAMQTVFGVIETWIRENPEQWMWTQRIMR